MPGRQLSVFLRKVLLGEMRDKVEGWGGEGGR